MILFSLKFKKNQQAGFSLLGVMFAIFITMTVLVGILNLISTSLQTAFLSQQRLVASGLAQEGIEIIRNIRERQADWSNFYAGLQSAGAGYYLLQYNSSVMGTASGQFCDNPSNFLRIDSSGFYQYVFGDYSSFCRQIYLSNINANSVDVKVEVVWKNRKGSLSSLVAQDQLWRWR